MKTKRWLNTVLWVSVWLCLCTSCARTGSWRVERTLRQQQRDALQLVEDIYDAIPRGEKALLEIADGIESGTVFFVFNPHGQLVFWSSSWLSKAEMSPRVMNEWVFCTYGNADGVAYQTFRHGYRVQVHIPVKYHYSIVNRQLHHTFIPPFKGKETWMLTRDKGQNGYPIRGLDGGILFYLHKDVSGVNPNNDDGSSLVETFSFIAMSPSYEAIKAQMEEPYQKRKMILYGFGALSLLFIVLAVFGYVRYNGWRNMPIFLKTQYYVIILVIVCGLTSYGVVMYYAKQNYRHIQLEKAKERTEYIQLALRNMFFWDIDAGYVPPVYLNADLRDLSFTYHCDINLYDVQGRLIGSSSPEVFSKGLMSIHLVPQVVFGNASSFVVQENIGDLHYVTVFLPFINGNNHKLGYISTPYYMSEVMEKMEVDAYVAQLLPFYLVILFVTFILNAFFSRTIVAPLRDLGRQMQDYHLGASVHELKYTYRDEASELVRHYNKLVVAVEESARQLAKAEREGAWRTMARQVAHEINNALTPMKLTVQQLQRVKGTPRFDTYFDTSSALLVEQMDNLSHIASTFSSFAKMPDVVPESVDIASVMRHTVALCRENGHDIPIVCHGAEDGVTAWADPHQIGQVFINLIKNAIQAQLNTDHPMVEVEVRTKDFRFADRLPHSGQWVEVSVSDHGPGIAEEMRPHIFVPNFTTKTAGAGLGLAFSKNVVENCGGQIGFDSSEKGTTFYVFLTRSTLGD